MKIKDILVRQIGGFILPEKAARKILSAAKRKKLWIVFPFNARLFWFLFRLMPGATVRYSSFLIKMVSQAKTKLP